MLLNVAIGLAVLVAVILVLAALKPPRYRVQRSTVIDAPPQRVFPLIADFRKWRSWSPWEGLDPNLKRTYEGPETGKGAVYGWDGNKAAGAGRMEIMEATSPSRVVIQLDFTRPFEAHNITEFDLTGRGASTDVSWAMHGPQPFMFRVMSVFMSMDKMVGKDFEKGLGALKAVAEGRAAAPQEAV
jgi:uncharacterized protein YndB with AHSA1/START domain